MKKTNTHHILCEGLFLGLIAAVYSLGANALENKNDFLQFNDKPTVSLYKPPAPNIILSVDDSGSMSYEGRLESLKEAIRDTFLHSNAVEPNSIRLGWMAMNACKPLNSTDKICRGTKPKIRVFNEEVRQSLKNWVDELSSYSATPSHTMLYRAGEYFSSEPSIENPWAEIPGEKEGIYLGCRRSYNIFLTDGAWNLTDIAKGDENAGESWLRQIISQDKLYAIGNADGTKHTLPDGTVYDPTSNQTKIYSDKYGQVKPEGNSYSSYPTLSDLAFYYWANDLQPHIKNKTGSYTLEKKIRRKGVEFFDDFSLQEYWNPQNDPAIWPHMSTFMIGFGSDAQLEGQTYTIDTDKHRGKTFQQFNAAGSTWNKNAGDYTALVTGKKSWSSLDLDLENNLSYISNNSRLPEMWHSAINSRAAFVPVKTPSDLTRAFKEIIAEIITSKSESISSGKTSASTLRYDSFFYTSAYNPDGWSGNVRAYKINKKTGIVDKVPKWEAANGLDLKPHTDRKIFSHNGTFGIKFEWHSLSKEQQSILGQLATQHGSATIGEKRVDFIRGKVSSDFRQRKSILGDIVNSEIWQYNGNAFNKNKKNNNPQVSKTNRNMLYVGANDGMLHGFNANDGNEEFAYIPIGLYDKLAGFSEPEYFHEYFVDGSPFVSEVEISKNVWRDYLVGTLGFGGKGFFILDVTNPDNLQPSDVIFDTTNTTDPDIGYIFGSPSTSQLKRNQAMQLTKMNDGRWAYITGNGYNSRNQNSVLLIQYLDGELIKLSATPKQKTIGNGLSTPRLVDLNGDGIPDIAYAGDLSGALWKFHLGCSSEHIGKKSCAGQYQVAFNGNPLFVTPDNQAITTAPAFMHHSYAPGLMILFGTGRNLTLEDSTSSQQQAVYGIHDRSQWHFDSTGGISWQDKPNDLDLKYKTKNYPIRLNELSAISLQHIQINQNQIGDNNKTSSAWRAGGDVKYYPNKNSSEFHKGWYWNLPLERTRVLDNIEWGLNQTFVLHFSQPAANKALGEVTEAGESCSSSYSEAKFFEANFNAYSGNSINHKIPNTPAELGIYESTSPIPPIYIFTIGGGKKRILPPGIDGNTNKPSPIDQDFTNPNHIMKRPSWRQVM